MDFDVIQMIEKLKKPLSNIPDERKRLERVWQEYRGEVQLQGSSKLEYNKNAAHAEAMKTQGNLLYWSKRYREALIMYNQALSKTPKDSPLLGILYANRSAVYFVTNRPLECLENIDLALEHDYPKEKRDKLEERREKCMEMINEMPEDEVKPKPKPMLTPALSHPAHPKFPFLSNAVDVVLDPAVGPQLMAKKNLQAGDTFLIDPFYFRVIDAKNPLDCFSRCAFCLLPDFLSLIPCDGCTSVMFCKECLPKWGRIHRLECGLWYSDTYGPLYIRALVQILDLYNYDFEKLKQDIVECQSSPGSILEGDYVNDLEHQVVRWIFPRWKQLDLTDWIGRSIYASTNLVLLSLNPAFKAIVTSFDKEIVVQQVLFSLILQTAIHCKDEKLARVSYQPFRGQFLTNDDRLLNARYHSSALYEFTYCLRPVKRGDMIKVATAKAVLENFSDEDFQSGVLKKCYKEGNEKLLYELLRPSMPDSHKTSKKLKFSNFNAVVEMVNIAKGDKSAKLLVKDCLIRILNGYDRYFPCVELAMVMFLFMLNMSELYMDKNYLAVTTMSKGLKNLKE